MTYFSVDPDDLRAEAERQLRTAVRLLEAATKVYRRDECRTNLIALRAAERLVKETTAQCEEWTR